MTALVASLIPKTVEEGVVRARRARRRGADLVEFRVDLLREPDQVGTLVRTFGRDCIVACRVKDDGGVYDGDLDARRALLTAAAEAGAAWVDLENWEPLQLPADRASKILRSYHRWTATPRDLPGIVDRMAQSDADALKVTLRAYDAADLDLVRGLYDRGYRLPLSAFVAGEHGFASRFLALLFGAPFVYCRADEDAATAPGQPDLFEARELYRARDLESRGAFWGLCGSPVAHSLGVRLHNRLARFVDMAPTYLPFDSKEPERLLRVLRSYGPRFLGLSVTAPLKRAVLPLCDVLDEEARTCGAVNTLVHDGSRLRGYNTDVVGVRHALERGMKSAPSPFASARERRALILGGGGSARAAARALLELGARVAMAVRTRQKIRAFAEEHAIELLPVDGRSFESFDPEILVHATPIGQGDTRNTAGECLVDARHLHEGMLVLDLVYAPPRTPLVARAIESGCVVVSGLAMFLYQARAQIERVLGVDGPDVDELRPMLGPISRLPLVEHASLGRE